MRDLADENVTDAVVEKSADCKDARLRQVMHSLVRRLHAFMRDVELGAAPDGTVMDRPWRHLEYGFGLCPRS